MYNKIDQLISGSLSEEERDQVWEAMMKDPELFGYYRVQLGLAVEIKKGGILNKGVKPLFRLNWVYAAAAVLVLAVSSFLFILNSQQNSQLNDYLAFNPYDIESFESYRSNSLNENALSAKTSDAVNKLVTNDFNGAIEVYNQLLVHENLETEITAMLLYNKSLALYALEQYKSSEELLIRAFDLSSNELLKAKIVCSRLKILVAENRIEEAKKMAEYCLKNNSMENHQKQFIQKLVYAN